MLGKIIGALILLLLSLGIYVSLEDLANAVGGIVCYALFLLFFAGVTALFDARARRLILLNLRTFSTGVTALFIVVLVFAAAALVLGLLVFIVRTLLGDGERGLVLYEDDRYGYRD